MGVTSSSLPRAVQQASVSPFETEKELKTLEGHFFKPLPVPLPLASSFLSVA